MASNIPSEIPPLSRDGSRQSFFRSAQMSLIQLYIPTEAVQAVVAELGELSLVQFRDLNPDITAFQRTFTSGIRKLDEMERKILVLLEQANKEQVEVRSWLSTGPSQNGSLVALRGRTLQEIDELESGLGETESRILQLDKNQTELQTRYLHMLEWHGVISALSGYMATPSGPFKRNPTFNDSDETDSSETARLDDKDTESMELGGSGAAQAADEANFVAGAILKRKMAAFERVLGRALRGNVYIKNADCVLDPRGLVSDEDLLQPKSAFVAYVHGRETLSRLRKICEALGCTLYNIDPLAERRNEQANELVAKLNDMYAVLFNTRQAKRAALGKVSESLERWLLLVRKKKALLDTMNCFSCDSDVATRKYYVAEGWCPTDSLGTLDASIKTASERAGISVAPVLNVLESGSRTPPTHFPTNRFTLLFQDMTESYGIPRYGEANPSLFMIITFPFLFAVMFGDIGHGLIMALFGAWMVLSERRLQAQRLGDIFEMIFAGRYVIMLMGIFSVFTGLIYNDFLSRSLPLFKSAWIFVDGEGKRPNPNYVYPFGIDWAWSLSSNATAFINSYKMKLSITLGVIQMIFGVFVCAANRVYSNDWLDIYCTIIPQLIFMFSILGYLVFMIIYKWIAGWDHSILNMLISLMLSLGAVDGTPIYPGQALVQRSLLGIAFLCVPWMFAAKPVYLMIQQKKHREGYHHAPENSDSTGAESISSTTRKAAAEEEGHGNMELWVHQAIHTIEFVLGAISNTASYLRLWALSLAHSELSDVLWHMTIEANLQSAVLLIVFFPIWFVSTIGILVVLEGLSAFLHALRLHWVEFNSKFYVGDGIKFEPFSLRNDNLFLALEPQ
ncbi:V-type proton ATPase subunit a [Paramicrosporidium saccamoebae]|uniref:V-type proton ATPase subunit a n=1 Tax=Paramicrosporidium saccamoebae TaxID=1246581 RepID=A0A2H9TNW7_9FUNG|nr:V-type proton ATPase subunit a [Paramicrosporidium saccamoebae]